VTVASTGPVVVTRHGAVEGLTDPDGVHVFRGVPYAADTSGPRRWRPPAPPERWDGIRPAHTFGPACPQHQRGTDWPTSEDCLSVNVWTASPRATDPRSGDRPRPVLVWVHGGRFTFGSGRDPQFDGVRLASRGIVVVTFNYRLGVLGYLATPELSTESGRGASGNYGLLDQVAALAWVRDNIAAFGGDPGRVTVAGQSAGAASVMALVYSPLTEGLLHGAIAESGAGHPGDPALAHLAASYRLLPDAEREGADYQRACGAQDLAALRATPLDELLAGNDADEPPRGSAGGRRPPLFRPVLEGYAFPRTYAETLALGAQHDVPVMTGTTKDEDGASPHPDVTLASFRARAAHEPDPDAFLALYPAVGDDEAAAMSNQAARDRSRTSTYLWSRLWAEHATSPSYTYWWTHVPPGPDAERDGAFHSGEISYFLDSLHSSDRPWTDEDRAIAATTSSYVLNFVRTGDPNGPGLPRWEPALPEADTAPAAPVTMELGDRFGPLHVAEPARFAYHRNALENGPRR